MKKYYTFEPKNFQIFAKMRNFIALALLLVLAVGNVNAQVYQKVTDVSQLAVGDQVIIAADGFDYAISTTQNNNNRAAAAITKSGDEATWTTDVAVFTLEEGTVEGTFAFKTDDNQYIYAAGASSNNYLKTKATKDNNGAWLITISGSETTIVAQNGASRNHMRYNPNGGNPLFSAYASTSTVANLCCLYKAASAPCPDVTNLQGTATENTATFTWTSEATEFDFELDGQPVVFTPTNAGNDWTLVMENLEPNTTYSLSVKPTCSGAFEKADATTTCPVIINNIVADIMVNETYEFGGEALSEAGTYQDTIVLANGCDSVIVLTLTVTVPQFTITATAGANGTITPVGDTVVDWHATPSFAFAADDCYAVATLTVNGTVIDNPTSPYVFDPVEANGTIEVTFAPADLNLTWTNTGNGDGLVNGQPAGVFATAACGEMVQGYDVEAAIGSHIASVKWNNYPIVLGGNITAWTINIPMTVSPANAAIEVDFELDQHEVTATVNDGTMGTATPATATVNYGTDATVTIAANTGYHIDRVVCGSDEVSYGANTDVAATYTVNSVTSDTTVEVYFAINTYTLTVNAGENGTVTPGTTTVDYGADQTFTITPNACYHIASVQVDGVDVALTDYTFTAVDADATLDVVFALDSFAMTATIHDPAMGTVVGGTAGCGSTFTYEATANTGYHIDSVAIAGTVITTYGNQPANVSFNVSNVQADTDVDFYFSINQYAVTATATNGTATPASATVAHGGSQIITLQPDPCYELTSVTVNGEESISEVVSGGANTPVEAINEPFAFITNDNASINIDNYLTGWSGLNIYSRSFSMIRVGTGSALGKLYLPELNIPAGTVFTVEFDAKAWKSDATSFELVMGDETRVIAGLSNADNDILAHYTETFTATSDPTAIVFKGIVNSKNRFQLDNIVVRYEVAAPSTLTIDPVEEATDVVATFTQISYPITASVVEGEGTINADATVLCGQTSDVVMTATTPGNHINYYVVNGDTTLMGNNTDTDYTLTLMGDTTYTVEVAYAVNEYTVYTQAVTGQGSFDPMTQTVAHGNNADITVRADYENGYHIADINGETYGNNTDTLVNYTLANVVSDTTLRVNFALNVYPITVTNLNPDHGTVAPTTQDWTWGENAAFNITPNTPCYYISEISVDGTALVAGTDYVVTGDTYTFLAVVDEHTLQVDFTDSLFSMTATITSGSDATVNITDSVHCGDNFTFHIEAAEGQHLTDIYVDGVLDTTFTNQEDVYEPAMIADIHENHNVEVSTAIDYYDITISSTGDGTTNLDGAYNVAYNTAMDFVFAPTACVELASFTINGEEYVDSVVANAYTWHATGDATIEVVYDSIVYNMTATFDANGGTVTEGTVVCGNDYEYTITAEEGWHVESYTIGGTTTNFGTNDDTDLTYTVVAASQDTNLTVVFAHNTYAVNVCTVTGGTLVSDLAIVDYDSTAVVTVTADYANGYHIESVDNQVNLGANDDTLYVYEVTGIRHDTTICAVFDLNNYTITATANANGNITDEGDTIVKWGDNMSYTITSNTPCYYISTVVIDGVDSVINDSVAFNHTFANVQNDHTIEANFETYRYEVATSVNDVLMGTITETDTLDCGETFNYTVTPTLGYHIVSVAVDGVDVTDITDSLLYEGSIDNLLANHTVVATFDINHYLIDVTAGANGTVTPGDTVLEHGQDVTYTLTPDDCYYISEIILDGAAQAVTNPTGMTFTLAAVSEAHTLEVNFDIYTYEMQETHTGDGTVTTATVNCDDPYTYTIQAGVGYHIASYEIGGTTVYNTEVEPNDYNTETVTVANARQDTMLTVVFEIDTYTVSACTAANGTLVVNAPVEVDSNANTTVTVTADYANGYHIAEITDNRGGQVTLGANIDTTYTYQVDNVDQDIEVCAVFALNEFHITATAGANGTITPDGVDTILYGETLTYSIEPNHTCYYISDVVVDGASVWTGYTDSVNAYTYTFVASDFDQSVVEHTITTEYTIFEYEMASNAITEGTVTSATVDCGTDYDYEIHANVGYHIDHVVLNGTTTNFDGQIADTIITITDVQSDNLLDVYFSINHYDIVATTNNEHGTITPAGTTDVEHFSSLTYTITPEEPCYHIEDVLVDGASVGAVDTYTFSNIAGPHTIEADFAINRYAMNETHTGNGTVTTDTVDCGDAYQYTMTADTGWHIQNHTLGGQTYTLNHNSDMVAYRNVTAAMQDTVLDVVFARNLYNIDVTSTGNGVTTPGDTTVEFEADVTYNMVADSGHHILSVTVDGTAETVPANATTFDYTFTGVAEDHTLEVVYEANVYTITASADPHGTIMMAGANEVEFGGSVDFAITADHCYNISAVLVDGVADPDFQGGVATATYTMSDVNADHTVTAQFAINTYDVTVTSTGNGTVTPTTGTYNCGDTVAFTFTPATGVEVESVVVNGQNLGSMPQYVINGIEADYTVDVTFADITYTLTAVAYNNGTITPEGDTVVAYDGTITYTLTPDACQTVSEILVDGVSYLDSANFDGTTLTLSNIQRDMRIQAYFQVMTYTVEATQAEGGLITETGVYNCGTDVVYTITPAECYTISDVTVDGASVGAVDTYTFAAIDTNHTITATFEMNTYTITANAGNGGTITATDTFNCGETPTYVITPDTGYYIVSVMVDSVEQGAIDTYTFGALDADHTIDATFAIYTYTITSTANVGVTIAPIDGDTVVEYGANLTYTFTVDSCYEIVDVMVDGESVGAVNTFDLSDIQADHVISVSAAILTYNITATVTGEGSITPAGVTAVNCDGTQNYTITPAVGYVIDDVTVDGTSVGVVTSYTFTNVTADHTIDVVFTAIADSTYTITATASANGTITPAGAITVNYGASQTFVMTPDEFYTVGDVLVDSVSVGAVTSYTFTNVTADHTIDVIFVAAECEVPTLAWTDEITGTSAKLNWTDMGAASYTVRYKLITDTVYTVVDNITDNFYELTGLTENTRYVWNVRSACISDSILSNWSSQQVFQTEGDTSYPDGIIDNMLEMVNVYSHGHNIYVVNNGNAQINEVQVFDMNGRLIYTGEAQANPTVINLNSANGLYVVRVISDAAVRNYKVSISQR
jgi:hypothetical protein